MNMNESTKVEGQDRLALALRNLCIDRFKYLYKTMGDDIYKFLFYEPY